MPSASQSDSDAGLLRFAHELLDETDAIARHRIGTGAPDGLTVTTKPDRTLVTEVDTEVETRLRARIADAFPTHTVLGEEFGAAEDAGDGRWIIDPIDATHNVVRGIEVYATLLAFERDGELDIGLVSAPGMHRRWFARRGAGAYVRADGTERQVHVSGISVLADAQIVFSTLRGLDDVGLGPALHRLTSAAWRDRGFGDFWGHMLVAQGSAEAMLEYGVAPYDMAAPYVVVTEAGGRMTDLAGRPSWSGPQVLTSNGPLHDELLRMLSSDG